MNKKTIVMLSTAERSRSISTASLLASGVSTSSKMLRLRFAALSMTIVFTLINVLNSNSISIWKR